MEKSAKTIVKSKFQKLSARQQHRLLATLAEEAKEDEDWSGMWQTYAELHSWTAIDRYEPPAWLLPAEAALACRDFHLLFGDIPRQLSEKQTKLWTPKHRVEVVLDQVRMPYNVGSILRLMDNFGFTRLVHASPWLRWDHPRLVRAARGSQAWIPMHCTNDLPGYIANADVPVFAIEASETARDLNSWHAPEACVLVLGNESYGVSKAILDLCDGVLKIPMHGFKHSMNVSHALAVVGQYWLNRQSPACQLPRSSS